MRFVPLALKGAFLIEPELKEDSRGAFARTFCIEEFGEQGLETVFVQHNQSWNLKKGTLRGLHYQNPPFAEAKYLRVLRGAIWDVIVDIRKGSPTFKQYVSVELSEDNHAGLYMPPGFAHGFLTTEDDTEIIYMHSALYKPGFEAGFRWDDPGLGIEWPSAPLILSEKDAGYADAAAAFEGLVI